MSKIRWYKNGKFTEDDIEHEDDRINELKIIAWGNVRSGSLYIMQEIISESSIIFYDNYLHDSGLVNVSTYLNYLTDEDMNNIVYNNSRTIGYWVDGKMVANYWKNIPENIKLKITN